jgi:hypothetical protein
LRQIFYVQIKQPTFQTARLAQGCPGKNHA